MKLTFVLLTAVFLNVSAKSLSQQVTFSGKNVELINVFTAIKEQTGYSVFGSTELLKNAKPVTLKVKNMPLAEVLNIILKDQPFNYEISENTILLSNKPSPSSVANLKPITDILAPPGSVQGRVTNENGEPLAGANVVIKGTNLGTVTDNNGYYKIENIATGKYSVGISYVGYKSTTVAIKVSDNNNITFDIKLTPSLVNLDQITIASTLSARKIRSVPTTIAAIEQNNLKNRSLYNIANVLEMIPGIIIQPGNESINTDNRRQPFNLLIRGAAGIGIAGMKYLIDGVEIISPGGNVSILQTMDPNDIEKIEVLKGPMASTLYGSGAGGGVIAITTKKGKPGKTKFNLKTMFTQYANDYANYNGYNQNYSLNISGGDEKFNYLLGAGYNMYPTPKLSDTSNGINDNTWSYTVKINGKTKNLSADLSLQYGTEKYGVASSYSSENKYRESLGLATYPLYPLEDYKNYQSSFFSSLHLKQVINNKIYHDLTVGFNTVNPESYGYTNDGGIYRNYEYLYSKINVRYFMFYDHDWSKSLNSTITAGFEYNSYGYKAMSLLSTTPVAPFLTSSSPAIAGSASLSKGTLSSTGYFAEIVTGFKNNLFLTTGLRYEVNPAYGDSIHGYPQPRIGLSYVVEPGKFKIKPRVVWGVSSDAPYPLYKLSYTEAYSYVIYNYIGNSAIKPQRSEGYEFGADIFYGTNYSLNVTYYDQKINDMIQAAVMYDFTTSPLTATISYYNKAEVINRGLEISAKAIVEPFTVDISFTRTNSKWGNDIAGTQTALVYPGAPLSNIPKKSLFAQLGCKIPSLLNKWSKKGGNINLSWRYNGSAYYYDGISYNLATDEWENSPDPKPEYPDVNKYYLWQKGYSSFNLRTDYSVTNYAVLYVDIQNLLNKQGSLNGQSYSQFPGRRINFGCNITF